jgi:hypothetical protein
LLCYFTSGNEFLVYFAITVAEYALLSRKCAGICYNFSTMRNKPLMKITVPKGSTLSPEDVTRSREGILKAAGSWKQINIEAFKAYINNRRQTATRTLRGGDL